MSTQLEFLMQLYMMNLLQQQQYQQEQIISQRSPKIKQKSKNSVKSNIATYTSHQNKEDASNSKQHHQKYKQNIYSRTQNLNQNQNITFHRSSSSCSPLSLSSPTATLSPYPLQQLLLNTLPPLTQLSALSMLPMSMSSNLLLTPTTPNTSQFLDTTSTSATKFSEVLQTTAAAGNYITSSSFPSFISNHNKKLTASSFLQSSTVTSTPTLHNDQEIMIQAILPLGEEGLIGSVSDIIDNETKVKSSNDCNGFDFPGKKGISGPMKDIDDVDDEDEKPLSSFLSSSGESYKLPVSDTKSTINASVQALESTDSADSSNVLLFTPNKKSTDCSYSTSNQCGVSQSVYEKNLNVTPLLLSNALLTPPLSEQLVATKTNEPIQKQITSSSLTTTLSLDAFLQDDVNLKNLKKMSSFLECKKNVCRQENLREHFHCFDVPCEGKTLSKKDDIIRHLKWHKKRKESLLLGFSRFSASDDCETSYGAGCIYVWKQTHYHCIYKDCTKVYVSTSDVQMHANFHRKNSEIVQEGFRRFRAHENCKTSDCPFFEKKISHYHCCREGCNHTFKNKADMEKHKSYHLKDYQLTQDGFKKILKTETCPFESCKFSGVCNHIHCVRKNCKYILHSSTQMISHKRKHDRLNNEHVYQNHKNDEYSPLNTEAANYNVSTPLSSLSADHFLSRKRGRPPKKIELPTESFNIKRMKSECDAEQISSSTIAQPERVTSSLNNLSATLSQFLSNLNSAAAVSHPPIFQMTHLMALFQLQSPFFYQHLFPSSVSNNLTNLLCTTAAVGALPQDVRTQANLEDLRNLTGVAAQELNYNEHNFNG